MSKRNFDKAEFRRWLIGGSATLLFSGILICLQRGSVGRLILLPFFFAGVAMISVSAALFDPGSRFNNNVVAGAVYASQILFFFISSMVAVFRPVDPNVRVLGSAVLVGTLLLLTATIQKIRSVRSSHLSQLERQELLQKLEEHYNELNETLRDFAVETARKNEECPPVGSNPADIVVCGNARSRRTSRLVLGLTVGVAAAAVVGVGFGLRQIGKAQGNQKS